MLDRPLGVYFPDYLEGGHNNIRHMMMKIMVTYLYYRCWKGMPSGLVINLCWLMMGAEK